MKLLKKELKVKDDKIARLTEHSMMMASQMDKWKGEVARLNARLKEAQTEIEVTAWVDSMSFHRSVSIILDARV